MKKLFGLMLLCATMVLSLSSCSDDDEVKETTYTLNYLADDAPDGFEIDITLFEYNDKDERVGQNNIDDVKKGYSETFVAGKNSKKVKVYMVTKYNSISDYTWVQQVYYLELSSNIDINLTNDIRINKNEP